MEDLISRRISYIYEPEDGPSRDVFKGKNDIFEKLFGSYKKWFNSLRIHRVRRRRKMYVPPIISVIITKKDKTLAVWILNTSFGFNRPSDILSFCFASGEVFEQKMNPEAFLLSVDGKLWPSGPEKMIFRMTFPDGRVKMRSGEINSKRGRAILSSEIKKDKVENDITLSASNAFWAGSGKGTRHSGPNLSITPNKTVKSDTGYESIDLGSPNSRKKDKGSSSKGSVYVLTNVEIPNKVKIGYTTRSAEERARELSGTGVPGKWRVAYDIEAAHPKRVERKVHEQLSHLKSQSGEFFEVDPRKAAKVIKSETKA